MANEKELYHAAQARLEGIKLEAKIRLDTLEARLDNAVYPGEKSLIQAEIDKFEKVFVKAIEIAQLNVLKAEGVYLAQKAVTDADLARQQAFEEKQLKVRALREFILAGGLPDRFEGMWPQIRQMVISQRVVANLIHKAPEPPSIHL